GSGGGGRRAGRRHAGTGRCTLYRVAPRRPPGRSPTVAGAERGNARRTRRGSKDASMKRFGLVAFAVGALLLLAPHDELAAASANNPEPDKQLNLFGDVFELVRSDYVDETTAGTLVEGVSNGMLTPLDPPSTYRSAKNWRFNGMKVETGREFGGRGIEVSMENGLVKVVSPIDDTPAAHAGLKPGDLVSHLDGTPVQGLTLPEAVEKMRGPINSDITLTIRREDRDPFDVKLTRANIKIQSVRSQLEGGNIGDIRINSFTEQTDVRLNNSMTS